MKKPKSRRFVLVRNSNVTFPVKLAINEATGLTIPKCEGAFCSARSRTHRRGSSAYKTIFLHVQPRRQTVQTENERTSPGARMLTHHRQCSQAIKPFSRGFWQTYSKQRYCFLASAKIFPNIPFNGFLVTNMCINLCVISLNAVWH